MFYNAQTGNFDTNAMMADIGAKFNNKVRLRGFNPNGSLGVTLDFTEPKPNHQLHVDMTMKYLGYPMKILYLNNSEAKIGDTYPVWPFYFNGFRSIPSNLSNDPATIDNMISSANEIISDFLAKNFIAYFIIKGFEREVMNTFVANGSFPEPEKMWDEFVEYCNGAKNAGYDCGNTIGDFSNTVKNIIIKNTAFWINYLRHGDPGIMKTYGLSNKGIYINPSFFPVLFDLEEICVTNGIDDDRSIVFGENFINELNCVPATNMNVFTQMTPNP